MQFISGDSQMSGIWEAPPHFSSEKQRQCYFGSLRLLTEITEYWQHVKEFWLFYQINAIFYRARPIQMSSPMYIMALLSKQIMTRVQRMGITWIRREDLFYQTVSTRGFEAPLRGGGPFSIVWGWKTARLVQYHCLGRSIQNRKTENSCWRGAFKIVSPSPKGDGGSVILLKSLCKGIFS